MTSPGLKLTVGGGNKLTYVAKPLRLRASSAKTLTSWKLQVMIHLALRLCNKPPYNCVQELLMMVRGLYMTEHSGQDSSRTTLRKDWELKQKTTKFVQ